MASAPTTAPARAGTHVLGVEPDAVTRALIELYLEPRGYRVRMRGSIADALVGLQWDDIGLFICSTAVLRDGASEHLERLRERLRGVPVALLEEPWASGVVPQHGLAVRCTLAKPLQATTLLAALNADAGSGGTTDGESVLQGLLEFSTEMGMEDALLQELLASFLARGPAYITELDEAIQLADAPRVDRTAHAFKGMCANLRFLTLAGIADRLRQAAKRGDLALAAAIVDDCRVAYAQVEAALRQRWPQMG